MYVDNKEAELAAQIQEEIHKTHIKKLSGKFFHEPTNSGFIQVNRIEGNSVQNGTPIPDKPIDVKSFEGEVVTSGKNLIDMDYLMNYFNTKLGKTVISKEADGSYKITNLNAGDYEVPITLNPNKRYAMRFKYKNNNYWAPLFQFKFTDGRFGDGMVENGLTNVPDFVDVSYVIPKGKVITNFRIHNSNNITFISWYKDFQLEVLEEGQEAPSEYEPFHATKTEKITLRSLPNGVKDTLERQNDGSYLLTQRVGFIEYDGTEDWSLYTYVDFSNKIFSDESYMYDDYLLTNSGQSNRYIKNENSLSKGEIGFFIGGQTNRYRTYVCDSAQTADEFKNKLVAWKNEGKPLIIYGELKNYIQRKVWLSPLSSYEGQTNIFANSEVGAEMEVEVLTTNAVNQVIQSNNQYIKSQLYKKNLLINPNFMVNQRYNNSRMDSQETKIIGYYFSDCWKTELNIDKEVKQKSLKNGGLIFANKSNKEVLCVARYYMDKSEIEKLVGKTLTLTYCFDKDKKILSYSYLFNGYSKAVVYSDGNKVVSYGDGTFKHGILEVGLVLKPNEENIINWVKLEEGDIFTGYEEPDYETELAKCQYFYKRLFIEQTPVILDKHNTILLPTLNGVAMRIAPTVKWSYTGNYFVPNPKASPVLLDKFNLAASSESFQITVVSAIGTLIPEQIGTIVRTSESGNYVGTRAVVELNAEI